MPQVKTSATPAAVRLNKAIAQAGICSRRAADQLILDGAVRVNDVLVDAPGMRIDPDKDRISVNGRPLTRPAARTEEPLYLAMYKPAGTVTTASDPQGRQTVLDLLPPRLRGRRPVPVGRLDLLSEGLLLLTTDGDLTLRLTHPRYDHAKFYQVWVRGRISHEKLETMASGMRLAEGDLLAPVQVRVLRREPPETILEMVLRQGVNRQIRRMCRDLKLHVARLIRVQHGPVRLGDLAPGAWRFVSADELRMLNTPSRASP